MRCEPVHMGRIGARAMVSDFFVIYISSKEKPRRRFNSPSSRSFARLSSEVKQRCFFFLAHTQRCQGVSQENT